MSFSDSAKLWDSDFSGEIYTRYQDAAAIVPLIQTAALDPESRIQLDSINSEMKESFGGFDAAKTQRRTELEPAFASAKQTRWISIAALAGGLLLGIILVMVLPPLGIIIGIGGIIAFLVLKKMAATKATEVAQQWVAFNSRYIDYFGGKGNHKVPASGCWKSLDEIYLDSLEPTQKQIVLMQRQNDNAMAAQADMQAEMHAQAMALQKAQLAEMREMRKK